MAADVSETAVHIYQAVWGHIWRLWSEPWDVTYI